MTTKTSKGGRQSRPAGTTALGKSPQGKKGGRKGRKPIAPVKVGRDRNWGPIALFVAVGVAAVAIIGFAWWGNVDRGVRGDGTPWQDRAAEIEGIVDYNESNPEMLTNQHQDGVLSYEVLPPVGGDHNNAWQNCTGLVYEAQIANEHAVHSLEHGAVWITYRPDLPEDQVGQLADMVEGADYTFLSPFPDLDAPISLQAWGYQLKVDDAGDGRIRDFILALRNNTGPEAGRATCGGPNSVTTTGTTPTVPAGGGMN